MKKRIVVILVISSMLIGCGNTASVKNDSSQTEDNSEWMSKLDDTYYKYRVTALYSYDVEGLEEYFIDNINEYRDEIQYSEDLGLKSYVLEEDNAIYYWDVFENNTGISVNVQYEQSNPDDSQDYEKKLAEYIQSLNIETECISESKDGKSIEYRYRQKLNDGIFAELEGGPVIIMSVSDKGYALHIEDLIESVEVSETYHKTDFIDLESALMRAERYCEQFTETSSTVKLTIKDVDVIYYPVKGTEKDLLIVEGMTEFVPAYEMQVEENIDGQVTTATYKIDVLTGYVYYYEEKPL